MNLLDLSVRLALLQGGQVSNEPGRTALRSQLAPGNPVSERLDLSADIILNALVRSSEGFRQLSAEEVRQWLRSRPFVDQLDRLRLKLDEELNLERTAAITVAGLLSGASLVYVYWLIRGGILLGTYLSAMPAWRLLDPLAVLPRDNQGEDDEEDEEDEDDMFAAFLRQNDDPLRGFD